MEGYRYELDGLFYYFEHRLHKGERIFGKDFGMDEGVFRVDLIRRKDTDGEYWELLLD